MKWDVPLTEAVLLKRYKRFLADISIEDNFYTAHVPNTGSMQSCWEPNWKCAVSKSTNPSRKLPYTLELIWNGETWIGVNTTNANKLVKGWLEKSRIPELDGYRTIISEKKIGQSRIDFYLEDHPQLPPCYVEVKNVTLKLDNIAQFPDSVSLRGQKHLKELMDLKSQGLRAVMLYVVQREDVFSFAPARDLDPNYSMLLKEAHNRGVEILVYKCKMDIGQIGLDSSLPFELG